MRNNITILLLTALVISLISCEKDTPQYLPYEGYTYAELNTNGGNWVPVLQSSGDAIDIAVPMATDSQEYLSEIQELKEAMSTMTSDQRKAIKY